MPTYITRGRYTAEAIKNLAAHPQDRRDAVAKLAEAAGGRLVEFYITMGESDFLAIMEAPSAKEAVATAMAAAAGGGATDMVTVEAFTGAEAKTIFAAAGKATGAYKPPGT